MQQEESFKEKMGRMKSFYDATLKKLNAKNVPKNQATISQETKAKLQKEYHL